MTRRVRFTPLSCTRTFAVAALAAAALLGAQPARAAGIPFAPAVPISSLGRPSSVSPADVDRDGDLDLVASWVDTNQVAWLENAAGDGSAWTLRTIATATAALLQVATADLDGDGDQDVLATVRQANAVLWYENSGNGSAWTPHTLSTAVALPWEMTAADIDRDGDVDVVAGSSSANDDTVYFLENVAGNGTVWTARTVHSGADFPRSLEAADLDGDGDRDVLVASVNDQTIAWHDNVAGNGSLWVMRTVTTAGAGVQDARAVDVDGDGDLDVMTALLNGFTWYENVAGNGQGWTTHTMATGVGLQASVRALDVDGDGDVDAVSASLGSSAVQWHENVAGNGTAWTPRTIGTSAFPPTDVVAADLDGDGDQDVASLVEFGNQMAWYRNDSIHQAACFTRQPDISTGPGNNSIFTALAAVDVDGDGDQDATSFQADSRLSWHENSLGDGSSWIDHTVATSTGRLYSIVPADTNGDGDADLVTHPVFVVTRFDNAAGNGTVWSPSTVSPLPLSRGSLDAADLDGDGDPDLLVPDLPANHLGWFENPGTSGSWTPHTIATQARLWAASADVDGDGDQDVMSADYSGGLAWYENVGGGAASWTPHPIPATSNIFAGPRPVDIDGDGDPDLFTAGLGTLRWLENGANGSVWTLRTVATSGFVTSWVDAGDLDGDGDVDGVAFDFGVGLVWYENTANGTVWLRHTGATQSSDAIAVARVADLDADGDLDLLHGRPQQSIVGWSRNDGGQVVLDLADQVPPGVNNNDVIPIFRLTVTHGGRAGDSDLELARIGLLFEEGPGDPLSTAEANGLIEELRVYRDANGNGTFDPGIDTLVATVPTLALTAGVQTIALADGDPNLQVAFGTPRTFFVVAQIAASASEQAPNQFRATHLATGPSATLAEDRSADLPLTIACAADLASRMIGPVVPVELTGFTVE